MTGGVRRSLVAVAAALVVSAIAWPIYGARAFLASAEILAPLGALTTLLASLIAGQRARIRGLRLQLGALALLAAAQLAVAVALFAALMFVSSHDAFFMVIAAGYAGLIGLGAARLVSRRALDDLDAVRRGLAEMGEGSRELQILVRGRDELAALARDVEAMATKVASEERARRELVAAVSHDLRTPITTLQLIADAVHDGIFEPERVREHLQLMSKQVQTLGRLIDDLFELSRLETGDVRWTMEQVPLAPLLQETIEAMQPQAAANGVAVRAELDGQLTAAHGNPEQIQRVLFNLIQNAIRHTPPDGSVVIRAERGAGPAIEIEVADNGAGVDPALGPRIFEPFMQGPSRVAGQNGSAGLGLAIARAIVSAHGGRIWLAQASPGTRIRFSLPAS